MGLFTEQVDKIRGRLKYGVMLDEVAWFHQEAYSPGLPSYKVPQSKVLALSQMIQLNGMAMMQLSRAMAKGDIRSARTKLRRIYHRMDAALRQIDQLDRDAKRRR